jgi:hypothetical protein
MQNNGPYATVWEDEEIAGTISYMKYSMEFSTPRHKLMDVKNKIKAERKKNKEGKDCALSTDLTYTQLGHPTAEC